MCVYSSLTDVPLVDGATMPSTGWIMIKQWNGTEFAEGDLTLDKVTAHATGASTVGFLEIMGDESSVVNANRLGSFNVYGAWYQIGTTNGNSNQTMQIPNNGTLKHIAGVFIEQNAGAGDYEFYPNAGTTTTTGTEAARGKVVWIDKNGLVRIGNSGSETDGYTPASGLAVVVGNVFFCNCTTSKRTAVVIPNATLGTRHSFNSTGGGVINIDKCNMEWYLNLVSPYSVALTNSGFVDAISLNQIATPISFSKIGVGNKPTTALSTICLTIQFCSAGGTISDSVFARVDLSSSSSHTVEIKDITGFTFNNCTFRANTNQGSSIVYSIYGVRLNNCVFNNTTIIEAAAQMYMCDTVTFNNTSYVNVVSGTTSSTYETYVWYLLSTTKNCTFNGLSFPVTNTHPYNALLYASYGCSNIKLRNIGTRTSPLSFGSSSACGYVYNISFNCSNFKIQRVYVSNTRKGIGVSDNSCHDCIEQNTFGDYSNTNDTMVMLNQTRMGMGCTGSLDTQTAVYGTHWYDCFTSTTAGRVVIMMNEPTGKTINQVSLTNGAVFTSTGKLYMPNVGQSATFTMPNYLLGHTQYANSALVMGNANASNYNYNFSIDLNDGAGWSAMTTANYSAKDLGTALNAFTLDASKGHKLSLQITTATANTSAIYYVYLTTASTASAQDYQYPLDLTTLTLTGVVPGSDIVILDAGTINERVNVDSNPASTYNFVYSYTGLVDIKVYKQGYVPFSILNYNLSTIDANLPIQQIADRNFLT
jgi:hypothetical protein